MAALKGFCRELFKKNIVLNFDIGSPKTRLSDQKECKIYENALLKIAVVHLSNFLPIVEKS